MSPLVWTGYLNNISNSVSYVGVKTFAFVLDVLQGCLRVGPEYYSFILVINPSWKNWQMFEESIGAWSSSLRIEIGLTGIALSFTCQSGRSTELSHPHRRPQIRARGITLIALVNCANLASAEALSIAVFLPDLEVRLERLDFREPVKTELCASLGGLTRSSEIPGCWSERTLLIISQLQVKFCAGEELLNQKAEPFEGALKRSYSLFPRYPPENGS